MGSLLGFKKFPKNYVDANLFEDITMRIEQVLSFTALNKSQKMAIKMLVQEFGLRLIKECWRQTSEQLKVINRPAFIDEVARKLLEIKV